MYEIWPPKQNDKPKIVPGMVAKFSNESVGFFASCHATDHQLRMIRLDGRDSWSCDKASYYDGCNFNKIWASLEAYYKDVLNGTA